MPRRPRTSLRLALLAGAALFCSAPGARAGECVERLDTGVDLTGWSPSATNQHGPGEGWTVEDGAIVGRQTGAQLGGILMSDRSYSDVGVSFEVQIDWGCDSGFFLRTTDGDRAYQVLIDHVEKGGIGTLYGEGFETNFAVMPFTLADEGHTAVAARGQTPGFDLEQWATLWQPAEFNSLRVRMTGSPPRIQVWISDVQVMDATDDRLRSEIAVAGPLALQVHSGARWTTDGAVRFRNIVAEDLTSCVEGEPAAGAAGAPARPDAAAGYGGDAAGQAGEAPGRGGGAAAEPSVAGAGGAEPSDERGAGPDERDSGCALVAGPFERPWLALLAAACAVLGRRAARARRS